MTAQRRPRAQVRAGRPSRSCGLWLRLLRASRAHRGRAAPAPRPSSSARRCRSSTSWRRWSAQGAGMTMTELSRFLMVSNGNVTGIIDRLVAEGLVIRLAHAGDRRATFVRLTRDGTQELPGHGGGARGLGQRAAGRHRPRRSTRCLDRPARRPGRKPTRRRPPPMTLARARHPEQHARAPRAARPSPRRAT